MLTPELDLIPSNPSTTIWYANEEIDVQRNYMIFPRPHITSVIERALEFKYPWHKSTDFHRLHLFWEIYKEEKKKTSNDVLMIGNNISMGHILRH